MLGFLMLRIYGIASELATMVFRDPEMVVLVTAIWTNSMPTLPSFLWSWGLDCFWSSSLVLVPKCLSVLFRWGFEVFSFINASPHWTFFLDLLSQAFGKDYASTLEPLLQASRAEGEQEECPWLPFSPFMDLGSLCRGSFASEGEFKIFPVCEYDWAAILPWVWFWV